VPKHQAKKAYGEGRVKLHTPAALFPRREPLEPTGQREGLPHSQYVHCEAKNLCQE